MNIIKELKKNKLISWSTLLVGFEKHWITKQDIEDYAISLLMDEQEPLLPITLLADASNYSDEEIVQMVQELCNNSTLDREKEIQKLKLATLSELYNSSLTKEEKCNKLQELYAEFNFPEDMQACSIYNEDGISSIRAMESLITELENRLIKRHS